MCPAVHLRLDLDGRDHAVPVAVVIGGRVRIPDRGGARGGCLRAGAGSLSPAARVSAAATVRPPCVTHRRMKVGVTSWLPSTTRPVRGPGPRTEVAPVKKGARAYDNHALKGGQYRLRSVTFNGSLASSDRDPSGRPAAMLMA